MNAQTPQKRGYVFTFGVKDAPPEQYTIVASSQEEAQKAADAHCKAMGWLAAALWDVVAAPKVIVVSGNHMLPIASWATPSTELTVEA